MTNKSDKPDKKTLFYESLAGREYTISMLIKMHGITRVTATKWLQQANVPVIEGTWPPRYHLPGLIKPDGKGGHVVVSPPATELEKRPDPVLQAYLKHLLDPETEVDVAKMFREVKDIKDIERIVKGLDDTLAVARYYSLLFTEDGLI